MQDAIMAAGSRCVEFKELAVEWPVVASMQLVCSVDSHELQSRASEAIEMDMQMSSLHSQTPPGTDLRQKERSHSVLPCDAAMQLLKQVPVPHTPHNRTGYHRRRQRQDFEHVLIGMIVQRCSL